MVTLEPSKKIPNKIAKKIQKIKKLNSGFISIQKGLSEAEKERKNFQPRIPFILNPGKKIPKKIVKKLKKLKLSFQHYFFPKRVERG